MADPDSQLDKRLSAFNPIALANLLRDKGFGLSQILASTGIHPEALKESNSQFTYGQFRRLIRNAIALTDNQALGLAFGRLNFSGAGVMTIGVMTAESFSEAILFASRTLEAINPALSFDIEEQGDFLRIEIVEHLPWEDIEPFIVETGYSLITFLAGMFDPGVPCQMRFSFRYQERAKSLPYHNYLPGEYQFGAETNSLYLPLEFARRPMQTYNPATVKEAEDMLKRQIQSLHDDKYSISQPMRQMILDSPGNMLSIEDVAARFYMSSRTLNRRLKQMGTSFSKVLAENKYAIAQDLLTYSADTIEQIAYKLGYSDPSSFAKAFKSWGGIRPSQYREACHRTGATRPPL